MIYDFFDSMSCVFQEEVSDYRGILDSWRGRNYHVAFMPAIHWHGGTLNLFEQKARNDGKNMIWIVPAGQKEFWWFPTLKKNVESFYQDDEIDVWDPSFFPEIEAEEFEECILLHSKELQNSPERTILGANVLLVRLSLSSGRDTIMFILLDHQDNRSEERRVG